MKNVIIAGSGSQARYAIDILKENPDFNIIAAVDLEAGHMVGADLNGVCVKWHISELDAHVSKQVPCCVIAHGDAKLKQKISDDLSGRGFNFISAISRLAYVARSAKIGLGCIVNPNVTIMPNANIKDHVIIHSGCVIEHDAFIDEYANIAPGVSFGGNVSVGKRAYIYTGAAIIPKITIGNDCIVGAGAVVTKSVGAGEKVAGVPARSISQISES
ncbi:MAG: hypothetical protein GF398_21135 [Chitinivibrionales bacterium]|nr:hypothetical protein [Chitinivibrionales bacterium]